MSKRYANAAQALYGTPWALRPEKLRELEEIFRARINGASIVECEGRLRATAIRPVEGPVDPKAIDPKAESGDGRGDSRPYRVSGNVAIVSLIGTMVKRPNMFMRWSGGASADQVRKALAQALGDPDIQAIVLDVDSPGGSVFGSGELAAAIFAARQQSKPIVAVANEMACSAAYYVASAAKSLVLTPSALVGSIGVYLVHEDWSKAEEAAGVKSTLIKAGRWKAASHESQPLSADGRQQLQEIVDRYYALFVSDVAKHRGMTPDEVHQKIADGRDWIGQAALDVGAADRIGTLDDTVAQLQRGSFFSSTGRAQAMSKEADAGGAGAAPAIEQVTTPVKVEIGETVKLVTPPVDPVAVERTRIQEISALLEISRLPTAEQTKLREQWISAGTSVAEARGALLATLRVRDTALGDAGGEQKSAPVDPVAKLKTEFAADAEVYAEHGVDEASYIEQMQLARSGAPLIDYAAQARKKRVA